MTAAVIHPTNHIDMTCHVNIISWMNYCRHSTFYFHALQVCYIDFILLLKPEIFENPFYNAITILLLKTIILP